MDLVIQILHSPLFLSQTTDQQQQTLEQIISTGELSKDEIYQLLLEEEDNKRKGPLIEYDYLTNLPYDVFVNVIDQGKIKGKDLIRLCSSSPKLREYCLRDRQYVDKEGQIYKTESQYVYRRLLTQKGITEIPFNIDPFEFYKALSVSYSLSPYNLRTRPFLFNNPLDKLPFNNENLFCKDVSTGRNYSLILDILGRVWLYLWDSERQLTLLQGLQNVVQVEAFGTSAAFLDSNGQIWTTARESLFTGDPQFNTLKVTTGPNEIIKHKIKKFARGVGIYVLDEESTLYYVKGYATIHITFIASNIKDFKLDNYYKSSDSIGVDYGHPSNRPIYDMVAITNSNEMIVFPSEGVERFDLKFEEIIPKKAIPYTTKIVILSEDGHIYIYDEALTDVPLKVKKIHSNLALINGNNYVDIDVISNTCIAVDSNGHVFIFNIKHPSEPQIDPPIPYLILKKIDGIDNAKRVSAGYYHVDILKNYFD